MTSTNRTRRGLGESYVAAVAYLATTWICVWLLKHSLFEAPVALRALVSLLPLIPIGFAIRAVVNLLRAGDELQRRIDLEALAVAAVLVGLGCLTLSFLLVAHVIDISARTAMMWVFPAQWVTYVVARFWAQSRYQ